MPAIIRCAKELKEQIKSELLESVQYTEDMDKYDKINAWYGFSDSHPISLSWRVEEYDGYPALGITETEEGLSVDFPIGAVYGECVNTYPESISDAFRELKKKYPGIGIQGECYTYETVSAYTYGVVFHCEPEDAELTVVDHWQECVVCGKILDSDTFYNSDQWETGEGDLNCICCPTCMLEYVIQEYIEIININESWSEEWMEEEEFDPDSISEYFWSRIASNTEEYLSDFIANKDRIIALANQGDLPVEKKAVLLDIIERIRNSAN